MKFVSKLGLIVICAVLCINLAACNTNGDVYANPVPNEECAPQTTVVTAIATEPAETAPVNKQYAFGDIVWSVKRSIYSDSAYVIRYTVVAQLDCGVVVVTPTFTNNINDFIEVLHISAELPLDDTGSFDLVELDNCYMTDAEAEAAAEAENELNGG